MTVFVDASALVAIIARETEAVALLQRLDAEQTRFCSALSAWEAVAALCKSHLLSAVNAHREVLAFLAFASISFVGITEREFELASDAYARFGKGRHPAALNMGDCFAYACAKANGAKLLFVGNDFTRTDIVPC